MKMDLVGAALFHVNGQTDTHEDANIRVPQFRMRAKKMSVSENICKIIHVLGSCIVLDTVGQDRFLHNTVLRRVVMSASLFKWQEGTAVLR
jgi:hypothetical protein